MMNPLKAVLAVRTWRDYFAREDSSQPRQLQLSQGSSHSIPGLGGVAHCLPHWW
jgi:hypothetical protein